MKPVKRRLEGDVIDCCDVPPPTCPRRYCSLAFRSFERAIGPSEPAKKKTGLKIRNSNKKPTDRRP
jgi:hypothetical protein